jgi:hypothetical protein
MSNKRAMDNNAAPIRATDHALEDEIVQGATVLGSTRYFLLARQEMVPMHPASAVSHRGIVPVRVLAPPSPRLVHI